MATKNPTLRWDGPQEPQPGAISYTTQDGRLRYRNKGIAGARRVFKRLQAEARNELADPANRRKVRVQKIRDGEIVPHANSRDRHVKPRAKAAKPEQRYTGRKGGHKRR